MSLHAPVPASFCRLRLRARLPFRFLRQLDRFPCPDRLALHRGVQNAADWASCLPPETSFRVDASRASRELSHSLVVHANFCRWVNEQSTTSAPGLATPAQSFMPARDERFRVNK
ncbi:MAG: THUMP domain-containing protein [Synechococcaceae cyanobacterium ELA263]